MMINSNKTTRQFNTIPWQEGIVLQESNKVRSNFNNFSERLLFQKKIIDHYLGKKSGMFLILPKGQKLLNALISLLKDEIGKQFNFQEYSLPKMINQQICEQAKISGQWDYYLLSTKSHRSTKGERNTLTLDPLQCTPFYKYLENKKLNNLPLRIFDVSGPTYRNEDKNALTPLIKQLEFRRLEFIYFDQPQGVVNIREQVLTKLEKVSQALNIPFRRVIGSGCYEMTSEILRKPAKTLDTIPIIDLEMKLTKPYKKRNKKLDYLEVVGASVLQDQQTNRFNIKPKNPQQKLWSGCVGVGLNRFMYAFLSNNGFDENKWPKLIKKYLD
jgi:seryl-tRNA synthetase